MSLNTAYFSVVATSIAICSVKLSLIHLVTARERLYSDNWIREKDGKQLSFIRQTFSLLLGASVGQSFGGTEFCDRCERIAKNVAENESLFFLMALGYGLMSGGAGLPLDQSAVQIVKTYTAARITHTLVYLLDVGTSIGLRGMVWSIGTVCNIVLAVKIVQSANP